MPLPQPVPSLVIRYVYLWRAEHQQGQEEGAKDRPCAVILVTTEDAGERIVTILPITHTPQSNPDLAVEIPRETKRRLGLDEERSWIVLSEANRFLWPGPDLRPAQPGVLESVAYGLLPRSLFKEVTAKLANAIASRRVKVVSRTD